MPCNPGKITKINMYYKPSQKLTHNHTEFPLVCHLSLYAG